MIIETSDNRFYRVTETGVPELAHVWHGIRVKRVKEGRFYRWTETASGAAALKNGRPELVRKAATRVVEA